MPPAITDWVRGIVMVVLFASFLELLLPSNGMQRFVRVIMGLLILLAILNPVIDILHSRIAPEVPALAVQNGQAAERVLSGTQNVVRERDRLALEMYRKDLARQIKAVVAAIDGVADARVAVETVRAQGGRTGAIEKLTVYIKPGPTLDGNKVAKVTVGTADEARLPELRPALKEKIVRTVCEVYQLTAGQVEVMRMN